MRTVFKISFIYNIDGNLADEKISRFFREENYLISLSMLSIVLV
jgi:hypothetical protein